MPQGNLSLPPPCHRRQRTRSFIDSAPAATYGRRKLVPPGRMHRWLLGPAPARAWDDLRLVSLRLIFLIVTRAVSLLGLSRREWWWKDAEILMLRHQLAEVAERERPRADSRLMWPDRAWLALLAGTVPAERMAAMRLIVTPGTILRWQRGIVLRRWARLSRRGCSGRPATHRKVRSVVLRVARENESWGTGESMARSRGPECAGAPATNNCYSAAVAHRATMNYMSHPLSVRLNDSTIARLGRHAQRMHLAPRTLAQRYVEEGLRMDEHPLIRFADGPAGRRARLTGTGKDVWEIIAAVRDNDGTPPRRHATLRCRSASYRPPSATTAPTGTRSISGSRPMSSR